MCLAGMKSLSLSAGQSMVAGVGPKTAEQLNTAGLARIEQIAGTPVDLLAMLLGRGALQIREFANGRDDRPLFARPYLPSPTVSRRLSTKTRPAKNSFEATLRRMADGLMVKVREDGKSVRTVTVRVRYNDMAEDQRSESLAEPRIWNQTSILGCVRCSSRLGSGA